MSTPGREPRLFQLAVRTAGRPASIVPLGPFPFVVGRSPQATCVVEAPGVWDRHLRFELARGEGLKVLAEPGALVLHDGEVMEERRVRNGDEFQAGSATLQVQLGVPLRRSLRFWEVALWTLIVSLVIFQLYLCVLLLEG